MLSKILQHCRVLHFSNTISMVYFSIELFKSTLYSDRSVCGSPYAHYYANPMPASCYQSTLCRGASLSQYSQRPLSVLFCVNRTPHTAIHLCLLVTCTLPAGPLSDRRLCSTMHAETQGDTICHDLAPEGTQLATRQGTGVGGYYMP